MSAHERAIDSMYDIKDRQSPIAQEGRRGESQSRPAAVVRLADPADPPAVASNLWVPVGPAPQTDPGDIAVSGRVGDALAVLNNFRVPGNRVLLVGARTGGLFRSTNVAQPGRPRGVTWQALSDFNGLGRIGVSSFFRVFGGPAAGALTQP